MPILAALLIGILLGVVVGIGYVALDTHYAIRDEDNKR